MWMCDWMSQLLLGVPQPPLMPHSMHKCEHVYKYGGMGALPYVRQHERSTLSMKDACPPAQRRECVAAARC